MSADGAEVIDEIGPGDYVWAWDEETGDIALKRVVETYVNETDELVHIFVNGEEIVCTPGHPFYNPFKGWTDAADLHIGDILVLISGKYVIVEKVQYECLERPIKIYNFQVENYHTYCVGNLGVLVHNKNCERIGHHNGNTPGNNEVQNKQFKDIVRDLGLDKDQARRLHDKISKRGWGYWQIYDYAKKLFHIE